MRLIVLDQDAIVCVSMAREEGSWFEESGASDTTLVFVVAGVETVEGGTPGDTVGVISLAWDEATDTNPVRRDSDVGLASGILGAGVSSLDSGGDIWT